MFLNNTIIKSKIINPKSKIGLLSLAHGHNFQQQFCPLGALCIDCYFIDCFIFVKKRNENPPINNNPVVHTNKVVVDDNPVANDSDSGLDRHPTAIHYSKHAKCRMDCRHIDETEVQEILAIGTINFQKSELDADACKKRYAVEGQTHDNQRVRIIFAPCKTIETVVTVIDLGKEWSCDCR